MTQLDNRIKDLSREFGVQVHRGDERLQKSRVGPQGWFCLVHGHTGIVNVLSHDTVYAACEWCLTASPHIQIEAPEVCDGA